jgi:hypothetical protein
MYSTYQPRTEIVNKTNSTNSYKSTKNRDVTKLTQLIVTNQPRTVKSQTPKINSYRNPKPQQEQKKNPQISSSEIPNHIMKKKMKKKSDFYIPVLERAKTRQRIGQRSAQLRIGFKIAGQSAGGVRR